jgi:hypothetical protein
MLKWSGLITSRRRRLNTALFPELGRPRNAATPAAGDSDATRPLSPAGGCAPDSINESKSAFLLRSLRHDAPHPWRRAKLPPVRVPARVGRWMARIPVDAATQQKYPVPLEYAKASFERIKQRLRHL